ncbi:uncharacterized protein LOC142976003 isoform X3 [Anticarsia gemmatalis]|uniref:uncharacterized protein LOC142976003 isoform X2 n=1 Tax=Anticarsia gemmatalis TaxID=129554 RepID=UPI003F75F112
MNEQDQIYILAGVFGGAWVVLLIVVLVMCCQLSSVKKKLADMQNSSRLRVQKLRMDNDKNHAFHNPALSPDEELSRRGYSMYQGQDSQSDVESGRHHHPHHERQTGGQFVEELIHELDNRQHRQQTTAPPFLLQSIQDNKMKTRSTVNLIANGHTRQSDTNPNFIY